jgi:nucleoside-diphosphate-sugar epimerase
MGSAEEYGKQEGPFKETAVLQPVSAYGISKAEATRLALGLYASENCPVVIARLFTVYGPHQSRSMFISDAVNAAVRGEPFAMSEGIQQRDLVFVNDIVTAIIACAREPEIEGRIINFGSGNPVRLRDLVEMIWRISRSSAPLMVGQRVRRNDDMDVTWADSSLAEELLSWRSSTDLETGLTATVEWARASKEFSSGAAIL